jgi:hypothetical protein
MRVVLAPLVVLVCVIAANLAIRRAGFFLGER